MTNSKSDRYHHGDLRAALLSTAVKMIAEGGVESVTMRALSQRIGVSYTAAYRHFANKAALLAAVAEAGFQLLEQHLQEAAAREVDSLAQFQQMGMAYVQFAVANATYYRLMFHSDTTWYTTYPTLNVTAKAVFLVLVNSIVTCQAQNKIKAEDPRALAHVVWALIHGLASLLIDGQLPPTTDVDGLVELATQTLILGLTPASPAVSV